MNKQRLLLPLEPDFNTLSDPSIIIDPRRNTWHSHRSAPHKRSIRRDLSKFKHRKGRRYSFASSSFSSSPSPKRSRKKKSKHSYRKRRHPPSSSCCDSTKDYSRYKRSKYPSLQASDICTTAHPDRVSDKSQNLSPMAIDNSVHQISKESGSESKQVHSSCVMISTDNMTYISKQGGTRSPNLCIEVWEILHWCLEHNVIFRICHIPGKFNILGDQLSRYYRHLNTEWSLDQTVASCIFQMLRFPNVDLRASVS